MVAGKLYLKKRAVYIYKVYIIRSPNIEQVYIGTTKHPLSYRFSKHVYHAKINYNCYSKHIINAGNAYIELLDICETDSKSDLEEIEGGWQEMFKDKLINKNRAGRGSIEKRKKYYEDNKERITKKQKEWRDNNKRTSE